MSEMQALLTNNYGGSGTSPGSTSPRFLEDSDGVVRLCREGEVLGSVWGEFGSELCRAEGVEWLRWRVGFLYWSRPSTFRLLQGASIQQLIGDRYVVVRCQVSPVYEPRPHLCQLEVAELLSPQQLPHREFYNLAHAFQAPKG